MISFLLSDLTPLWTETPIRRDAVSRNGPYKGVVTANVQFKLFFKSL